MALPKLKELGDREGAHAGVRTTARLHSSSMMPWAGAHGQGMIRMSRRFRMFESRYPQGSVPVLDERWPTSEVVRGGSMMFGVFTP